MSTEYFVVKPKTKELFYLGKRISYLEKIPKWIYTKKADYVEWEDIDDVFLDIYENSKYFLEGDMRLEQVWDVCHALFEWCDAPVYLDNDCNDENTEWRDWKETGSVHDFLYTDAELVDELIVNKIPPKFWVENNNVIMPFKTLINFIDYYNKEEKNNKNDGNANG